MSKIKKLLEADLIEINRLGIKLDQWIEIEDDVYHGSPGISASGLKDIMKCPALYRFKKDNRTTDDVKPEVLIVGSAVHTYILEPEKFKQTYLIAPSSDKRKKEWKEFVLNIDDADREKPILRKDSMDTMRGIKESLTRPRDSFGTNIYEGIIHAKTTQRELALYTVDKTRGILLKVKVDINFDGVLFDLKSTKNAKVDSFMKDAANLGYDIQASFYLKVAKLGGQSVRGFGFIGVEKDAPYLSNAIVMEPRDIVLGNFLVEKYLNEYTFCIENDLWFGYNGVDKKNVMEPMIVSAAMPGWHRYRIEEDSGFRV